MAYDRDDVAVLLADFAGTVTDEQGNTTAAMRRLGEVFQDDGQGKVKQGDASLKIATGSLPLVKQMLAQYQEDEDDEITTYRVRDWQLSGGGSFTDLIVVEEKTQA